MVRLKWLRLRRVLTSISILWWLSIDVSSAKLWMPKERAKRFAKVLHTVPN